MMINLIQCHMQIHISDIDFWEKSCDEMWLMHVRKMYPPRITVTVALKNPAEIVEFPVRFTGCSKDGQLDKDLLLPLGKKSACMSNL